MQIIRHVLLLTLCIVMFIFCICNLPSLREPKCGLSEANSYHGSSAWQTHQVNRCLYNYIVEDIAHTTVSLLVHLYLYVYVRI